MIHSMTQWLLQHDVTIDLITMWALTVGFILFGLVKLVSWLVVRDQRDQTKVGSSLKHQKLGEAALGFSMGMLYGMTLYSYYANNSAFGLWERTLVRAGLVIAIAAASVYGLKFAYHLWRERRRGTVGTIPLAKEE